MLRLSTVQQTSRVETVVRQIARLIVSGDLPPGALLPSQNQLVEQLGVSRAVVREAIATLSEKGLLDVRHGRGTLITSPGSWNILDPLHVELAAEAGTLPTLLDELLGVRLLLEPHAAAQAALRADAAQHAKLADCVQAMQQAAQHDDLDLFRAQDTQFHTLIAQAAQNRVLTGLLSSVSLLMHAARRFTDTIPNATTYVIAQHQAIQAAILAHDTAAAEAAMRRHVRWVQQHCDEVQYY